jgi:Glyoxalase-like domain
MDGPALRLVAVAIDCADPMTLGRFWQQLLGGDLTECDGGDAELRGGAVPLDFQRVPDPAKHGKNRLHLDLFVPPTDRQAGIDRALRLGASKADDVYDGGHWQVLRDPEGNEFCLVWESP